MTAYKKKPTPYLLLFSIICLLGIGILMVYSSSAIYANTYNRSNFYFFNRQLGFVGLGILLFFVVIKYPYQKYRSWIPVLLGICFVALILVLIPRIGHEVGHAKRWFRIAHFSLQPSELLKIAILLWGADFLDRKHAYLAQFSRSLFPASIILGVYCVLLLAQPDFGTAVLLVTTFMIMFFVAGGRKTHIFFSGLVISAIGSALVIFSPYRFRRIESFLTPWNDPTGSGYQLIQSLIAVATGGIFGKNLGNSTQKLFFLPEAHTDFIFAILAEELGFIGVCIVVFLVLLFLQQSLKIARHCKDRFGRNLACGIAALVTFQAIINMSVVLGIFPTKGIPFPFVSYGGSSLITMMILSGILFNIAVSNETQK